MKTKQEFKTQESITLRQLHKPKCQFCMGKELVYFTITDKETLQQVTICLECHKELYGEDLNYEYPSEIENEDDDKRHNI